MSRRSSSGRVSAFRRTPLVIAIAGALAQGAFAAVIPVTNGGTGAGSLYAAIIQANSNCSTDTAPFIQYQGGGPFTISPSVQLPKFQCAAPVQYRPAIDGTIAYGATPNTLPDGFNANLPAVLDGTSYNYGGCVLEYIDNTYGGMLAVQGLQIVNFMYGGASAICGKIDVRGSRIANNDSGLRIYDGSNIGGGGDDQRNAIYGMSGADRAGIEVMGGNFSIHNNFIGTPDGVTAAPNTTGIFYDSGPSPNGSISSNVIVSSFAGISIGNTNSVYISGNKIGTNAAGTSLLGTGQYGIALFAAYGGISGNTIGGATENGIYLEEGGDVSITNNSIGTNSAGDYLGNKIGIYDEDSFGTRIFGNAISHNTQYGIWLTGVAAAEVDQNFIGTNYGGTIAKPNGVGVYLGLSSNASFDNNVISGNYGAGFVSFDAGSVQLTNNKIGTTADTTGNLGNGQEGVVLECASFLTLTNNTIAYNGWVGLHLAAITSSSFTSNTIKKNVTSEGTVNGVELATSTCQPPINPDQLVKHARGSKALARPKVTTAGSTNYSFGNTFTTNTITDNSGNGIYVVGGNSNTFDRNIISGNLGNGIDLESDFYGGLVVSAASSNKISQGSNYGNGGSNILLGSGNPNNRQDRPTIVSALRDTTAGTTTLTMSMPVAGFFDIELFQNSAPGKPAGEAFVGTQSVSVPSPGSTFTFLVDNVTSDNFSATATETEMRNTSEFSDIKSVSTSPAVDIMPTSLDFNDVVVGRQSPQGTINITSRGDLPYVISQLRDSSCTGPNICSSGEFVCSTTCVEGFSYSKDSSCSITASFAPSTLGPQTHTLALCDNTGGAAPRTLTFTGNGIVAPLVDITITPSSFYFGEILVGAQSPAKTFTITNMGGSQVFLGSVKVSPDFVIAGNTCGPSLAGGASCATDVTFVPSAPGVVFGTVEVTGSTTPVAPAALRKVTSSTTNTVSATVQGSGVQFGDLRLPASISFGTLVLHGSPRQQTVTIANSGNGTLSLRTVSVSGPFTLGNPCPSTLAPGASCTITLDFNPASLGTFNGTLTVVSDAPGGTRSIPLTALVIADARPVVRVAPSLIGFGERVMGSASPARRVTISNEGAETAVLGAFTFVQPVAGLTEFSVTGTSCAGTLAPQATCFADVIMKPLGTGDRSGQMIVPSNSVDTPQVVTLGGTGCRPFVAGANRSGRDLCK